MTYILVMSRQVSVAEAKARFSALVSAAEEGEVITITRHGKPVATLRATPKTVVRKGGELLDNPEWANFVPPADLFAPMTDEELRAEGWE